MNMNVEAAARKLSETMSTELLAWVEEWTKKHGLAKRDASQAVFNAAVCMCVSPEELRVRLVRLVEAIIEAGVSPEELRVRLVRLVEAFTVR